MSPADGRLPGDAGLLDAALTAALGPVDALTAEAITGICDDAIGSVLGRTLAELVRDDPRLLAVVAPWARDLARGLQFQSQCGPGQPPTAELLTRLASRPLTGDQVRRFAETADLAAVLTSGRLLEQVLGPGACGRDPAANQAAAPWLAGLQLGYRIYLVLELLRLLAPGRSTGCTQSPLAGSVTSRPASGRPCGPSRSAWAWCPAP